MASCPRMRKSNGFVSPQNVHTQATTTPCAYPAETGYAVAGVLAFGIK